MLKPHIWNSTLTFFCIQIGHWLNEHTAYIAYSTVSLYQKSQNWEVKVCWLTVLSNFSHHTRFLHCFSFYSISASQFSGTRVIPVCISNYRNTFRTVALSSEWCLFLLHNCWVIEMSLANSLNGPIMVIQYNYNSCSTFQRFIFC